MSKSLPALAFDDPKHHIRIYQGDCLEILAAVPESSVDLVFADPPYFLSNGGITCHAGRMVSVNKGPWDKLPGPDVGPVRARFDKVHEFNTAWLAAAQRVLKPNGSIWVSGTAHVIHSVGFALQQLGFKLLNDISWVPLCTIAPLLRDEPQPAALLYPLICRRRLPGAQLWKNLDYSLANKTRKCYTHRWSPCPETVRANSLAQKTLQANQGTLFPLEPKEPRVKPFLKWAGGKTRLLLALRHSLPPTGFKKYFEPFLGGGALFFDLSPTLAFLGDSNAELMNCYEVVRDRSDELIQALTKFRVSESEFYRVRALEPAELPDVARAARLIYLNKTCYNGLYRVNKQGRFNTPYGRHSNVTLLDAVNVRAVSGLLKRATLYCGSYETVLELATKGDFIYFDPPYVPVGKFSDFKRYTKDQFDQADHERLAEVFHILSARGCFVLLSNSFNKKTAKLYSGFIQRIVQMPRFVNCKGEGRGHVDELLISNYKPIDR